MGNQYIEGAIQADTPITTRGVAVTVSSSTRKIAVAGAGLAGDGVLVDPGPHTQVTNCPVVVQSFGKGKGLAHEAIAAGQFVTSRGTDGALKVATTGDITTGKATTAAAAGQEFDLSIFPANADFGAQP